MKTALVTGAAGFIGSHLVEELLEEGYEVTGLDNLSTGSKENLSSVLGEDSFTFIEGDIRDPDAVTEAVKETDAIFHLAARASVQQSFERPEELADVNCTGTSLLLEVARDFDVDNVVVASSAAIYGSGGELPKRENMPASPESPYATSKYYTEQVALQLGDRYDIDTVALRYFNVFGPRQDPSGEYAAVIPKFIERMLNGKEPVIYGDGEQTRDFVYVKDVARANMLAVKDDVPNGVYNIAQGTRITINELVDRLNDVMEINLEPIHDEPRSGEVRHSEADISKATENLGFEPEVTITEGLRRTVDAFEK